MYQYKLQDGIVSGIVNTEAPLTDYINFVGNPLAGIDGYVDLTQVKIVGTKLEELPKPIPPAPVPPTEAEITASLVNAVQYHLDNTARARGYDGIVSVASYRGDVSFAEGDPMIEKFITEGNAYYLWRAKVWAFCYAYLAEVKTGTKPVPTSAELIAQLPILVL